LKSWIYRIKSMATIFSKIIAGEIPCYKVAENEKFLAFLDVNPLVKGHVLVVPKLEIDYIFDMDDELLGEMFVFAKPIAKAIEKIIPCKKVGVSVIGLEVAHCHIHLCPINGIGDMNFSRPKITLSDEEFKLVAGEITSHI
jgi:histidine triad (HIT) family protein